MTFCRSTFDSIFLQSQLIFALLLNGGSCMNSCGRVRKQSIPLGLSQACFSCFFSSHIRNIYSHSEVDWSFSSYSDKYSCSISSSFAQILNRVCTQQTHISISRKSTGFHSLRHRDHEESRYVQTISKYYVAGQMMSSCLTQVFSWGFRIR
jgi:hypothetical protein